MRFRAYQASLAALLAAVLSTLGGCCRVATLIGGGVSFIEGDCGQQDALAKLGIAAGSYKGDAATHWGLVRPVSPPAGSPQSVATGDSVTITFASLAVGMRGQDWPPGDSSRGDVYVPVLLSNDDKEYDLRVEYRGRFHISEDEKAVNWVAMKLSAGDGAARYLPLNSKLNFNVPMRLGPTVRNCNDTPPPGGDGEKERPKAGEDYAVFSQIPSWTKPCPEHDYAFTIFETVRVPPEPGFGGKDRLRRCPVSIRLYPSSNYPGTMPPQPTWIKIDSVTMQRQVRPGPPTELTHGTTEPPPRTATPPVQTPPVQTPPVQTPPAPAQSAPTEPATVPASQAVSPPHRTG